MISYVFLALYSNISVFLAMNVAHHPSNMMTLGSMGVGRLLVTHDAIKHW